MGHSINSDGMQEDIYQKGDQNQEAENTCGNTNLEECIMKIVFFVDRFRVIKGAITIECHFLHITDTDAEQKIF
jgi:hypothetical protein